MYLPLPGQKVCKVFEAETFGLDFGVGLASEFEKPGARRASGFLWFKFISGVNRLSDLFRDGRVGVLPPRQPLPKPKVKRKEVRIYLTSTSIFPLED